MRRPNFFIVGAPRCGTTALGEYLRTHPNVFMSCPKEPHFFAEDFSDYRPVRTIDAYLRLFAGAQDEHVAIGEASVSYLYSSVALRNIYEFSKQARILVMLRNPVSLVHSLHAQLLYSRDEDEPDFERAWYLQSTRKNGEKLPKNCRVPAFLQYGEVGRLGEQVERLLSIFPRNQVEIILFDDFESSAKAVYEKVLSFLGVQSDARSDFPRINEGKAHKIEWVGTFAARPPLRLTALATGLKKMFGFERLGILNAIRRLNSGKLSRKPLSDSLRIELKDYFKDDIGKVASILGRDLSDWIKQST